MNLNMRNKMNNLSFEFIENFINKAIEFNLTINVFGNYELIIHKDKEEVEFYCYCKEDEYNPDREADTIRVSTSGGEFEHSISKNDWLKFQLLVEKVVRYQERKAWSDLTSFFPEEKPLHDINDLDDKEDE